MDHLSYDVQTAIILGVVSTGCVALTASALVFYPKNALGLRMVLVAALATLTRYLVRTLLERVDNTAWSSIFSGCIGFEILSAIEMILIARVDAHDLSAGDRHVGIFGLLSRAVALTVNPRRVGTQWQIKDVPTVVPQSRARFIISGLFWITLAYMTIEMSENQPPPEPHLIAPEKESLTGLGNLTVEDIVFRVVITFIHWAAGAICIYSMARAVAVLSVSTGLSEPESWPPIYGPFSTLTTVRGFWGKFWHQALRKGITGIGDTISDSILSIPRGTLVSRYTRLFIPFLLSGLIHQASDLAHGLSHSDGTSVKFFCMQALGIMFEDAVQAATKRLPIPSSIRDAIGYIWTLAFMSYTTPLWFYPRARNIDSGRLTLIPLASRFLDMPKA